MRRVLFFAAIVGLLVAAHPRAHAQAPQSAAPIEFDVVSIKRNPAPMGPGSGMRNLPDGTFMLVNYPLATILVGASPVPGVLFNTIVGIPDWMKTENYDVTAKPPPGTTREQIGPMMQAMFAKRMKLVAHIEQRDGKIFSLVVARADGRLGPALKKSTLDCSPGAAPADPQGTPPDISHRCGAMVSGTSIVAGGMTMEMLARNAQSQAGGPVTDRTGLAGFYAFTLKFAPPGRLNVAPPDAAAVPSGDPDFLTALEEQLGLTIVSEKTTVPYFIIDHIERPTDN